MAAILKLASTHEASEIVEALLLAAATRERLAPHLAERWRRIAHDIGDALDQLPTPKVTPKERT